jgi:hypothetical protein
MPDQTTVYDWLMDNNDFAQKYARAREKQAEHYAGEIIEICDETANDIIIDPETGAERTNHEVVLRSKLRVDTRKWLMGKLAPKKYGDKTILSGDPDSPVRVQSSAISTDGLSVEELEILRTMAEKQAAKQS